MSKLFQHRFSSQFKWALLGIIFILLLPEIFLFVSRHTDTEAKMHSQKRMLVAAYRQLEPILIERQSNSTQVLKFPDCIRKWEFFGQTAKFIKFHEVSDVAKADGQTILAESKRDFSGAHLVLLLDGTVGLKDKTGKLSAIPSQQN